MKPLVSILIPCYNSEKWLAETLESANAQIWQNKEIIIIDDGSTDNSFAIAQGFESSTVKVIRQENQGQSAAENRALQEAQGDFIQYLDADDLLSPDKIEKQIQLLGDSNSEFVAACEWARFYNYPTEAQFTAEAIWADFSPVDWLICSWEGGGMMHGAAWLISRKVSERAGYWNEKLSLINDFDYFPRVLLSSLGIKFCWGAKTYYRSFQPKKGKNLSNAKSRAAIESAFLAMQLGTQSLLSVEDSSRTRHACATVFQRFIYENYANHVPDLIHQAEAKVERLGGSDILPTGGPKFQRLARVVGWKSAKRIQKIFQLF